MMQYQDHTVVWQIRLHMTWLLFEATCTYENTYVFFTFYSWNYTMSQVYGEECNDYYLALKLIAAKIWGRQCTWFMTKMRQLGTFYTLVWLRHQWKHMEVDNKCD